MVILYKGMQLLRNYKTIYFMIFTLVVQATWNNNVWILLLTIKFTQYYNSCFKIK